MSEAGNSWLPVDVDNEEILCDDTSSCVHFHVSDNMGKLCDPENSWLPVDIDNRETLCDDKSGLQTCSHER